MKWTPSLWPEDRKLLTWDTSCTCPLLSSLCWNSRHCQLHCHCVMKGEKLWLHYCVCVCICLPCSLLPQPDWLIHWQHTCFNALLIKFSTDPSSEIKHKQDSVSARRGQKSEAYLEGINNAFEILSYLSIYSWWAHRRDSITSAVLLSRKFYNSSRSNLLEMHKYAISGQTIITNNYQFVVCHASLKFILSIWSYLDQYIVCTHCTIKC